MITDTMPAPAETAPAVQRTRVPNLFDWVESAWPSPSAARSVFEHT
jgi:hypothetical protein